MRLNEFMTTPEIKERIAVQLEATMLLDILDIDMDMLVEILEEQIEDNMEDILKHLYD